jgi:hypothetical protein
MKMLRRCVHRARQIAPVPAALLLALVLPQSVSPQAAADELKVSAQPLTAEELVIYRHVLAGWMGGGKSPLNLADLTSSLSLEEGSEGKACARGLDMETFDSAVVHRIRPEDLAQLGRARLQLVEREAQQKQVEENDPSQEIRNGKPIGDAVSNGFAHGYAWLSEIRFDKSRTHAVVAYGFHCGSLCGNGGSAIFEKVNGEWKFKSQCGNWIS